MNEYDLIYTKGEFYPPRPIDTLDSIRVIDADFTCPFCGSEDVRPLPIRPVLTLGGQAHLVEQNVCMDCGTYFDPSFSWFWIPDFDLGIPTTMCHDAASCVWTLWVHEQGVGPMHSRCPSVESLLIDFYFGAAW